MVAPRNSRRTRPSNLILMAGSAFSPIGCLQPDFDFSGTGHLPAAIVPQTPPLYPSIRSVSALGQSYSSSALLVDLGNAGYYLCHKPLGTIGISIVALMILVAAFAPFIAPYTYQEQNYQAV